MPTTKPPPGCSAARWRKIYEISDADFWTTIRGVKGRPGNAHLLEAIRHGRGGRRAQAYRALALYHREAFAEERARPREGKFKASPAPNAALLRDLWRNRINVWHTLVVDFGPEIDWNRKHLGKPMPGFHYFGWFSPAVRDLMQTGNPRSREWIEKTVVSYWRDKGGIDGIGVLGKRATCPVNSRLGVRGKMAILFPAYLALLREAETLAPDVVEAFTKLFLGFARAMQVQMTYEAKSGLEQNGNISVAGAAVLFLLGKQFPEFRESDRWCARGEERFVYFSRESFFADGGYCERVWGYGVGALGAMTEAYEAAQRYGGFGDSDRVIRNALRNAFRWYAKTMGPNERKPCYGDGSPSPKLDPRPMNLAARVFPGCDRYLGVDRERSYLLKPSEFAIMRNGNDNRSTYINISFGKYAGWHSHYDQLAMNLWSYDTVLLEEQDRWGPYHNPLDIVVRAPEAHNLFLVDGMVYDSRRERGHDVAWHSDDVADCFTACHKAYRYEVFSFKGAGCFNMNGIVRRTVVFVKDPGYAVVVDSVFDESHPGFNRAVSQYWHSPFPFKVLGPALARTQGSPGCLLAFSRPDGLRRLECTAAFAGEEVEHNLEYPERHTVRARRWGRVEEAGKPGFATLLFPFKGKAPQVSIRPLKTVGGEPYRAEGYEVTTPSGRDLVLLNPERRDGVRCGRRAVPGRGRIILGNGRGNVEWTA